MSMKQKRKDIAPLRREQILSAAAELFANGGYHGVSVNAIARRAGISKGNLYWYFTSKEEIFRELFAHITVELYSPVEAILLGESTAGEKLRMASQRCMDVAEANPQAVRLLWQIAMQPELSGLIHREYAQLVQPFVDNLAPLFAELGSNRPEATAVLFGMTLDSLMCLRVMVPEMFDADAVLAVVEERFISYKGEDDG